jgi:predicted Zn finger-like uncharacterized protein
MAAMYTRCPECQSTFRITPAQIKAREGLVRCGRCRAVFQAGEHLVRRVPPDGGTPEAGRNRSRERDADRRRRRRSRESGDKPRTEQAEMFPFARPPGAASLRRRAIAWTMLTALLVLTLAGQAIYLNSVALARHPELAPWMEHYCGWLGCALKPPPDVARIELETSIAPHPRFVNALRIRADLINRADHPQPLPRMEVTLTDSEGRVLARRIFSASHYLPPRAAPADLAPNIVVRTLLDVTNPDNRAVGYEVRLLSPES